MNEDKEIYGNKFGTLFVGRSPEGKVLDIKATERGMQEDLDYEKSEWLKRNPNANDETERQAFDFIGEELSSDSTWYDDNLVWVDV